MGLLPFDDWIYHLPYLRDEVNATHQQAVNTQNAVQSRVLLFNQQLDKFKLLLSNNALLIYIDKTVHMDDLQLKDFTAQIEALPPPVKGDIVLNAITGTAELVAGLFVLKFIVNIGQMAKNALFTATEGAVESVDEAIIEDLSADALESGLVSSAESGTVDSLELVGEEVTEEVVQAATSASLAATGVGIFLAVGIDVIFGAINGAKEKDQLEDMLHDLQKKLGIVDGYLSEVNSKSDNLTGQSLENITLFKNVSSGMQVLLPEGHKATFDFSFASTIDNLDKCLAAQQSALDQFGLLTQLRNTYVKALARNPKVTKDTVISAVLLTAPDWVDVELLTKMWDEVLAKYSTLMKTAA